MSRADRVTKLEKAHGMGGWQTLVARVPYGMSKDTALALLGIQPGTSFRLILVTDFSEGAVSPRLISGGKGTLP